MKSLNYFASIFVLLGTMGSTAMALDCVSLDKVKTRDGQGLIQVNITTSAGKRLVCKLNDKISNENFIGFSGEMTCTDNIKAEIIEPTEGSDYFALMVEGSEKECRRGTNSIDDGK